MKNTLLILMLLCGTIRSFAQGDVIKFDTKHCGITAHPISDVEVIDCRADSNAVLGVVLIGREQTPLTTNEPLKKSIKQFYLNYLSSEKNNTARKLTVVLYTFYACDELDAQYSERTHFSYAASYFLSDGSNQYTLLGTIDTTIYTKKRKLLSCIDASLCSLYEDLYQHSQDNKLYSYNELINYEQEQKKIFAAYRVVPNDSNAVYMKWDDFLKLNKHETYFIEWNEKHYRIAYRNQRGSLWHVPAYAAVVAHGGKLYYTIEGAPYEMYKRGSDFFVTGATLRFTNASPNTARVVAGATGGALGYLAVSALTGGFTKKNSGIQTYEFKINYRNGKLIPIKRLDTPHK